MPALDMSTLEVPALNAPGLDMSAVNVPGLDVLAMDVLAVNVSAANVPGLDVSAVNVAGLEVHRLDVPRRDVLPGPDLSGSVLCCLELGGLACHGLSDDCSAGAGLAGLGLADQRLRRQQRECACRARAVGGAGVCIARHAGHGRRAP